MTTEENKEVVRRCFEEAVRRNFDAFPEVLTDDYVLHPEEKHGAEGLAEMVQGYHDALADLSVTVEHQFAVDDYVATRITIRGRHEGDLLGAPPTGRDVEFTGITISRCSNGKIAEEWEIADTMSLLAQVGAIPLLSNA